MSVVSSIRVVEGPAARAHQRLAKLLSKPSQEKKAA